MQDNNKDALPAACIFDCDGTLLDTMGMWLDTPPLVLASYGISTTPEDFAAFESLSLEDECSAYHEHWGIGETAQEVFERFSEILDEHYSHACARPGVEEFLSILEAHNIPMAVATSTPERFVRPGLKAAGIDQYIRCIVTTAQAGASKDHPDVYHLAARTCLGMQPDPQQVWVFEDAPFGLRSAQLAGYRCVGMYDPQGRARREEVKHACTVYRESFEDLSLEHLVTPCI